MTTLCLESLLGDLCGLGASAVMTGVKPGKPQSRKEIAEIAEKAFEAKPLDERFLCCDCGVHQPLSQPAATRLGQERPALCDKSQLQQVIAVWYV